MVNLTEKAAKRIKELLAEENKSFLRVAVQGGGCSGFQYAILTENEKSPADELVECHDVKVIVDPISKEYLKDAEIDLDDIKGFTVKNPQATRTCGCGQSFQVDEPPEEK